MDANKATKSAVDEIISTDNFVFHDAKDNSNKNTDDISDESKDVEPSLRESENLTELKTEIKESVHSASTLSKSENQTEESIHSASTLSESENLTEESVNSALTKHSKGRYKKGVDILLKSTEQTFEALPRLRPRKSAAEKEAEILAALAKENEIKQKGKYHRLQSGIKVQGKLRKHPNISLPRIILATPRKENHTEMLQDSPQNAFHRSSSTVLTYDSTSCDLDMEVTEEEDDDIYLSS